MRACVLWKLISCLRHSVRWDGDPHGTRRAVPQEELQILPLLWRWGRDETPEMMLGLSRLQFLCHVILCACVEHSVACTCQRTRCCTSCTSVASITVDHVHDEASFDQHEIENQSVATSIFCMSKWGCAKEIMIWKLQCLCIFIFGSGNPRWIHDESKVESVGEDASEATQIKVKKSAKCGV